MTSSFSEDVCSWETFSAYAIAHKNQKASKAAPLQTVLTGPGLKSSVVDPSSTVVSREGRLGQKMSSVCQGFFNMNEQIE